MAELKATNRNEQLVLDYINQNASATLRDKIAAGTKTLGECWGYIVSEAKKLKKGNCAVVDDKTVFGWAIHFFEEDDIKAAPVSIKAEVKVSDKEDKPAVKKMSAKSAKKENDAFEQLAFF